MRRVFALLSPSSTNRSSTDLVVGEACAVAVGLRHRVWFNCHSCNGTVALQTFKAADKSAAPQCCCALLCAQLLSLPPTHLSAFTALQPGNCRSSSSTCCARLHTKTHIGRSGCLSAALPPNCNCDMHA